MSDLKMKTVTYNLEIKHGLLYCESSELRQGIQELTLTVSSTNMSEITW